MDDLTETEMLALFGGSPPNGWKLLSVPVYAPGTSFDIQTTFEDIDNMQLVFLNDWRPYKRCLTYQAMLAKKMAADNNYLTDNSDFDEMWSNDEPSETKAARFAALTALGKYDP